MLKDFSRELEEAIERNDTIVLFRHVDPDPDASGSQKGLALWLKEKYPRKTILLAGKGMDEIEDAQIENALAIVTDTSNQARVDDERFSRARELVRMDHHVRVEQWPGLDYVDDKAAAACEIIALLMKEMDEKIPQESAQALLEGLMADTQRFTTSNVRSQTYAAGGWLQEMGADPVAAAAKLYTVSLSKFEYRARIASKARMKDGLLFAVMSTSDYLQMGYSFSQAKDAVDALSGVRQAVIWALFTMMEDGIHYSASLRSRTVSIRPLAVEFGGGGHDCACGIKMLSAAQTAELIEKLRLLAEQNA